MTPTVTNVFALMCLRLMGAFAHNLMAVGKSPDEDILNSMPLNYSFIKEMKGSTDSPVTYKEECCFYLL